MLIESMDPNTLPHPGTRRGLGWTEFLSLLVELVGEPLEARLYPAGGHEQLVNVRGRFREAFDPFPESDGELFLDLDGHTLIPLSEEKARSIACWVETFGEPQPRLVIEVVQETTSLQVEAVLG